MSPLTADFGSVTEGETSAAMSFTVTNTGGSESGAITAVPMGSAAANFSIESNNCTTLAADATCTVAVSFSPASPGQKNATLSVSASPGGAVSATLEGNGIRLGDLAIDPPSNAFGNVVVGATSATAATFTVTNTGDTTSGTLNVTKLGSDPNDFTIATNTCTTTLPGAGTCTITVNFAPTSSGPKAASISVTATGGPGGTAAAAVSGTGLADALLAINPTILNFGSVVVGSSSNNQTFTVTNIGGVASGAVAPTLTGADASNFTIVSGNCTAALNPNATCNVTVQFRPTTPPGPKAAQLNVTGAPGGTASATLLGDGTDIGQIEIDTPTSFIFPDTTVLATSVSHTFTFRNTGGSATGALSTALAGIDPGHFTVVAGSNGCQGVVLPSGGICTIVITFTPTTGGSKSANLTVTGTPGGVVTAGLSGLAIPDALLSIQPASFDFGSVGTGTMTANQTFTVRNIGGQSTGALSVAVNGPNATQFAHVSGCAAALAPNDTCTIQVRFAPNINGNAVASLDVGSTPGGAVSAGLFGQGVPPADLRVAPSALVFDNGNGPNGEVLLGDSAILTFTVTNMGTEPTGTINTSVVGTHAADYGITDTCTTLPAGMSCVVTVTFTPSARGTRTGSVNVQASPGGNLSTSLTGDSLPRLELILPAANPFLFADTVINTSAPPAVEVRVRNNTRITQPFQLSTSPAFSAAQSFQFDGGNCVGATSIASDAECNAIVEFEPDTVGLKTATMTFAIAGGGANNTAVQDVRGTGVDSLIITAQTVSSFGNVAQNTASPSLVFVVTNPANSPTTGPIGTTIDDASFQIIGNTCAGQTLGAGLQCTITVKYLPTIGGGVVEDAILSVTANPGGSDSITITGTAVNPANLQLNPAATLAMGDVFSGTADTASITVTNPAGAAISGPVQFSLGGADAGLYSLQFGGTSGSDCVNNVTTLGPGASCNIRVRFLTSGTSTGARSATVTVSANPGTPTARVVTVTSNVLSTISVSPASHDYGAIAVGTTTSRAFTVTNNSASSVTITSTTPPGSGEFTITANTCTGTLASMATCVVTMRFNPATAGDFAGSFTVNSANGLATATLQGHGNTAPDVSWTETFAAVTPFDYGSTLAGELGLSRTFTLRNDGETTAPAIGAIVISDAMQYTVTTTCTGVALAPNATCSATVRFTPNPSTAETQQFPASIVAMNTTGTNPTINVTGRRMESGALTFTPTIASYPDTVQGLSSPTQPVAVLNTSGAPVTFDIGIITTLAGLPLSTEFTIVSSTCGGTLVGGGISNANLAAGSQCTVNVRFNPTTVGTVTDYLLAAPAPFVFGTAPYAPLTGRGLAPASVSVAGNPPAFPNTAVGASSQATIRLTNNGEVPTGAVSQSVIGGADFSMFSKSGCTGAIPAGSFCDLVVTFTPANVGVKSASFTVGATPGLATITVTLNATGVTNATIGITPTEQQDAGSRANGALDPAGTVYTITNGGAVPSGPLAVTLSNGNYVIDAGFAGAPATCVLGAPLAPGGTCQVRVKFNPTVVANNIVTTVTASANPGASAAGSIIGDALPALSVSPGANNFGSVTRGQASGAVTFTFENRAAVPTGLLRTSLTGTNATEFTLSGATADDCAGKVLTELGTAGDSCTITVRFTPPPGGTAGAKTATLSVAGTPGDTAAATLSGTAN